MAYYLARNLSSSFLFEDLPTKRYSYASTGLGKTVGLMEVEASRFQDDRHTKVVRLPALWRLSRPQGHCGRKDEANEKS
jgi:hypothetical protein